VSGPALRTTSTAVLLIEDEAPIRKFLRAALEGQGYTVVETASGKDGLTQAATRVPDLVLLDLGLPDVDGFEILRRIREWSGLPIIVLTARGQDGDKVRALDAGADDYVTKPFSPRELGLRVKAILRRGTEEKGESEHLKHHGLELDLSRHRCLDHGKRDGNRHDEEIPLTAKEFEAPPGTRTSRRPDRSVVMSAAWCARIPRYPSEPGT